jgi:hypothetical protein
MGAVPKRINTTKLAQAAMLSIRAWQRGVRDKLACPICRHNGLQIADRSARPHTAWFVLTCQSCALDEAIAIASSAHSSDHD